VNEIQVPKSTCVKIVLINEDPDIPHDFSIDPKSGENGMEGIYIPVNGAETNSFNVTTPDIDVTFDFYCSIVGHRAAGEEGAFIVGEDVPHSSTTENSDTSNDLTDSEESDSLTIVGYEFVTSLIAVLVFSLILRRKRVMKNALR
jgi:hypothetical protein